MTLEDTNSSIYPCFFCFLFSQFRFCFPLVVYTDLKGFEAWTFQLWWLMMALDANLTGGFFLWLLLEECLLVFLEREGTTTLLSSHSRACNFFHFLAYVHVPWSVPCSFLVGTCPTHWELKRRMQSYIICHILWPAKCLQFLLSIYQLLVGWYTKFTLCSNWWVANHTGLS